MKTRFRSVLPALLLASLSISASGAPAGFSFSFLHHGVEWGYAEGDPGLEGIFLGTPTTSGAVVVPARFSLDDITVDYGDVPQEFEDITCPYRIADGGFYHCSLLTSIAIPATITEIGADAFSGCTSLERVLLPDSFQGKNIGLPEGVTTEYYDTNDVVVATSSLPEATEEVSFATWIEAVGGTEPYSWDWSGSLPDGICLSEDGELYGTPWETGEFEFAATVTDADGATAERSFTLVVGENPNHRPQILAYSPQSTRIRVDPGSTATFSVSAADGDGDELYYDWSVYDENGTCVTNDLKVASFFVFPEMVSSFSFDTKTVEEGRYEVCCSVSDDVFGALDNPVWSVFVQPKTELAIATDSTLTNALTETYYYQPLEATGGEWPYTWEIVDPDERPEWLYVEYSGESWYLSSSWCLSEDDIGTYVFTLRVTDAEGTSIERTFSLAVAENPDHRPAIESWTPETSRFRVDPGATVAFSVTATDEDGDDLDYDWSVWDENDDSVTNAAGSSFAFETETLPEGRYRIRCSVSDGTLSAADEPSWSVLVQEKTDLAIATDATLPNALTEDYYYQPLEATGGEWPYAWEFVDPDERPEWLYVESSGESWYLSSSWCLSEDDIGSCAFALRVTDAEGTSIERTFALEVQENPNHRPVIESWTPESMRFRVDPGATVAFSVTATDKDGDDLFYEWTVEDADGNWVTNDSAGASFVFDTETAGDGRYSIWCNVSDGTFSASDNPSWTVLVQEKTELAIATDATLPNAVDGETYSQVLEATGGEWPYTWAVVDPDDWPGWLWENDLDDGRLGGYPASGDIGTNTFALRVTDAEGTSRTRTFTLEVRENPNHEPVIGNPVPGATVVTLRVGETATFSVEASDPDGDDIEFSWYLYDRNWNWISDLEPREDGTVAFSPAEGDEGVYHVEVHVADDGSRSAFRSWDVTVVEADGIVVDGDLPHAVAGVAYSAQLSASGGTAPYTWGTDDTRVTVGSGGVLSFPASLTEDWDVAPGDSGEIDVRVTTTDAEGRSATQTVAIVVDGNPDRIPVFDAFSPDPEERLGTVFAGKPATFSVVAHDPDGEPLSFVWKRDGTLLGETGTSWTWTPERGDIGDHEFSVRCSDGVRWSAWTTWTFRVVSTNVLAADGSLVVAVAGRPYSASLAVAGGTEPYVWRVRDYDVSREANSFAETGAAQDWAEDDGCWRVKLPFAFPFYGELHDAVWVSDNGTICLDGSYSEWGFKENDFRKHALIAPLWTDMDGRLQTISVDDSVSGRFTVRWDSRYYDSGESDPGVSFSATLCEDGTIRFSYGEDARSGAVGISAGDGVLFLLPDELQGADLGGDGDVVFRPAGFAPGLALAANGTVSGTPTEPGTFRVHVAVVDGERASWTGTTVLYVVEADDPVTKTTSVPVPYDWLEGFGLGDGTETGYEAAAKAIAKNGRPVWACYVADLDPKSATDDFVAGIEIVDGEPEVTIERGESADRVYTVQGAKTLGGGWTDLDDGADWDSQGYRFFRVKAELP